MKDICCIGHITLDKIITPRRTVYMSGGTSFYFSYALNSLPKTVDYQLVTALGKSEMNAVAEMRAAGIDVKAFTSSNTVYFENKYEDNFNNRSQRVLAKADPFTLDEVSDLDAKIYHLGTLLNDDFSPEVVKFLSEKGKVSIDVQGYLREVRGQQVYPIDWTDKMDVLRYTDILKLNEHEMEVVTGMTDVHEVAKLIASWGVKEVVLTLGSEGSVVYAEGQFHEIPAYRPAQLIDATGCGDTYSAGYLWCRSQGESYKESGKFAAAMCTLKLEHNGPFDRHIEDVVKIIKG
ncbi:MAG: PfkB family carbohydrate kinase [Prevotella sp.]|nr:PfkB family carbohydrate kinase [Prevotella sp.]MDD7047164.1 PfkB family carbohydrate kinase [Prevotella sp.]MDY5546792.1 PfkB family carbohydrate kinase [Prevotella sp.]